MMYAVELGEKSGLLHYHMLVACPFIPSHDLNEAWGRIRQDPAPNCVRGIKKIRDSGAVGEYAAKGARAARYAAKCANRVKHGHALLPEGMRVWQTSHNLVGTEKCSTDDENLLLSMLAGKKCEVFKVTDHMECFRFELDRESTKVAFEIVERMNLKRKQRDKEKEERRIRDEMLTSQLAVW